MVLDFKINNLLLVCFISIYFSAGVLYQILNLSSYALTLGLMTFFVLLLLIVNINRLTIKFNYVMFIFCSIFVIYINTISSFFVYGGLELKKSLLSFIFLLIIFFIVPTITQFIYTNEELVKRIFYIAFFFISCLLYLAYVLQKKNILINKNMIIYPEPSHVALMIVPISLFVIRLEKNIKIKIVHILNVLILSVLVENLTLFLGAFLIFILTFKMNKSMLLLYILIILTISFIFLLNEGKLNYFLSRLTFNTESNISNLSVLVYLSGFERSYLSLLDSNFIGVGFNRMGYVGPIGKYQEILGKLGFFGLNLHDGGTTGSKLITELGIIGVFLLFLYLFLFIKIFIKFGKFNNISDILFSSYFLAFSLELFVRGIGYFSPNLIFFIASIYYLFFKKNYHECRPQCY